MLLYEPQVLTGVTLLCRMHDMQLTEDYAIILDGCVEFAPEVRPRFSCTLVLAWCMMLV